jgi:hypothetical protein
MNTSKSIRKCLLNDTTSLMVNFKKAINFKNLEIKQLNEKDFNIEYEIFEKEIERLLKEYILMKRLPGKDLRVNVANAVGFINKEIKKHLDIPVPNGNRSGGLFGRYNIINVALIMLLVK